MVNSIGLVIPCFNERKRLPESEVHKLLLAVPDLKLLFVDDGSSDGTADMLARLASLQPKIKFLRLDRNMGKAEAVRRGMLQFINEGFAWVGYADADFSTPAEEIARLWPFAESGRFKVVMGSRILRLGSDIHRNPMRHYLGRFFATLSSLALALPVYDTQCGAKLFAVNETLSNAIAEPFRSRWIFDVELIGRLVTGNPPLAETDFLEVPLNRWIEVGGSKFVGAPMIGAWWDLAVCAFHLFHRRRDIAHKRGP